MRDAARFFCGTMPSTQGITRTPNTLRCIEERFSLWLAKAATSSLSTTQGATPLPILRRHRSEGLQGGRPLLRVFPAALRTPRHLPPSTPSTTSLIFKARSLPLDSIRLGANRRGGAKRADRPLRVPRALHRGISHPYHVRGASPLLLPAGMTRRMRARLSGRGSRGRRAMISPRALPSNHTVGPRARSSKALRATPVVTRGSNGSRARRKRCLPANSVGPMGLPRRVLVPRYTKGRWVGRISVHSPRWAGPSATGVRLPVPMPPRRRRCVLPPLFALRLRQAVSYAWPPWFCSCIPRRARYI